MELHLTVGAEAKLNQLAERTHRATGELLEEAIDHLIAYNEWLERKVKESLATARRGEFVSDEEVRKWIEQRERLPLRTHGTELQQPTPDLDFQPVEIRGEPLSETVIRERR